MRDNGADEASQKAVERRIWQFAVVGLIAIALIAGLAFVLNRSRDQRSANDGVSEIAQTSGTAPTTTTTEGGPNLGPPLSGESLADIAKFVSADGAVLVQFHSLLGPLVSKPDFGDCDDVITSLESFAASPPELTQIASQVPDDDARSAFLNEIASAVEFLTSCMDGDAVDGGFGFHYEVVSDILRRTES